MSHTLTAITPLGLFGFPWDQRELVELRDDLLGLVGTLPREQRASVASYLRGGAIVFPIMEWTSDVIGAFPEPRRDLPRYGVRIRDVVGGRFDEGGGSSILTDGRFCWRRDTANYVEHYRIGLPEEFLRHAEAQRWVCPAVDEAAVLAADQYLMQNRERLWAEVCSHLSQDGVARGTAGDSSSQ